jgi:DNA mismatch endonuclease, patch repair protein
MSQIENKDTKPEKNIRKLLFSKGICGYRTNVKITGKPDICFTKYKIAIFIDGCYWHKCLKCFKEPQTNKQFWVNKINNNVERDAKINEALSKEGWTVLRFWEHEIKNNIDKCIIDIIKQLKKRGYKIGTN